MSIKSQIKSEKKVISIYGLGNVGGPIAAAWLRKGAKIIGVDISKKLLSDIKNGVSHKKEPFISETFANALKKRKLEITSKKFCRCYSGIVKCISNGRQCYFTR